MSSDYNDLNVTELDSEELETINYNDNERINNPRE